MTIKGKTILVTGATGLIGSHIVEALMKEPDNHVIALGRSEYKLKAIFADYLSNSNFEIIASDVSGDWTVEDSIIDYIFHAAGPMENRIIKDAPLSIISPNISGLEKCAEVLLEQKRKTGHAGRLIVFSSRTVYGIASDEDVIVTEKDTAISGTLDAGNACYFESKRMAEVITGAYVRQCGLDAVIARFSTIYGDTFFLPETAFFQFIQSASEGKDIILNSSGSPRRDNLYIVDAVDAAMIIALKGECGEAYNISSNGDLGNYAAVDEIAKTIAEISGNNDLGYSAIKVSFAEGDNNKRSPGIRLDNSKLKSLGWTVTTSLEDGIRKTMDDYHNLKHYGV